MYFGRAMLSDDRRLAKFVMTTTRSSQVTISTNSESGGLLKTSAHTIEGSKSGYNTKQTTFSGETGDAGTIKLVVSTSPYDWVGVIGTGQSLSVGCGSTAAINTTQPYHNLKLQDAGPDPK